MRRIHGDAHLEGLPGGRALLVFVTGTGERIGLERSPDQLRRLHGQISDMLPPEEGEPAEADQPTTPKNPSSKPRRTRAAETAA